MPGELNQRLREEISEIARNIKVNLLEGPKIIELALNNCPEIITKLRSSPTSIIENSLVEQGNLALNKALFINKEQNISDYACDLEFFFGDRFERSIVCKDMSFLFEEIVFSEEQFEKFNWLHKSLLENLKVDLLTQSLDQIKNTYEEALEDFYSKENQEIIKRISDDEVKVNSIENAVRDTFYSRKIGNLQRDSLLEKLTIESLKNNPRIWDIENDKLVRISTKVPNNIYVLLPTLVKEIIENKKQVAVKPQISFKFDHEKITSYLVKPVEKYERLVNKLSKVAVDNFEIGKLIEAAREVIKLQRLLFSNKGPFFSEYKKLLDKTNLEKERIRIPPSAIIDSGHNIALYGGAGFGKTTTLQSYAAKCSITSGKRCIFVELAANISAFKTNLNKELSEMDLANGLLIGILKSKNINVTDDAIKAVHTMLSNKTPILLDGLDEVFDKIPLIIDAIHAFSKCYERYQLVVSSRLNASYLDKIDFIGVSLLPFSEEQLNHFIINWCSNPTISKRVIATIKKKNLTKIVSNPLIATIICHLAESGVNIPQKESKIYEERLNLLIGKYDVAKGVERQKNTPDNLKTVALYIAFLFHEKSSRILPYQPTLNDVVRRLKDELDSSTVISCVNELIEPCDILQFNPEEQLLSFGHFRFQESLVALKMAKMSPFDLLPYLSDSFWRGAFTLYADSNSVETFFEVFARSNSIYHEFYYLTLDAMIDVSSSDSNKVAGLRQLLDMAHRMQF